MTGYLVTLLMSRLLPTDVVKSQPSVLQVHLSLCIDFILSQVDGVVSIILTGGYGRGEGTWIEKDDSYVPYNDYDFIVILDYNPETSGARPLSIDTGDLAARLGISWVDVDFLSINKLKTLKSTVKNYDILHGSTIIYGDDRILKRARVISADQISTRDLYTYFNTRAYTVLCCLPKDKKLSDLGGDELQFFRNQLAKGLLAVMDCTLISEYRFYCSSYVKRLEYYTKVSKNKEKVALFRWALNEKVDPSNNSFSIDFGHQTHERLYDLYQTDMNQFLGQHFYGIQVTLNRYSLLSLTRITPLLKFMLSKIFYKFRRFRVERALNHLQYILIMTWRADGCVSPYEDQLAVINKLVRQIDSDSNSNLSWASSMELVRRSR
jgi:hypothetical protein